MKKIITFLVSFIIVISGLTIPAFAVDTNMYGTFYTQEQEDKAKEIKNEYGIDAIYIYIDKSEGEMGDLRDYIDNYIVENNLDNKYFILALNRDYYYYEWSADLDDIFHSVDGSYIATSIYNDDISVMEDNFYSLLSKMLYNRTNCPYKYIKDQAGVLTDEQEKELNDKLTLYKENNGIDLVVVLTNGIDNGVYYYDDRMDFADDYYDYNGYDKDGALLLVNIEEFDKYSSGNSWISTSGKCIRLISEDDISRIGSHLTPYLEAGEFYEAINYYPDLINSNIKVSKTSQYGLMAIITIVICIIVAFVYTGRLKRQLKSVSDATDANEYIVDNSLNLRRSYDHYLYSNVVKTPRDTGKSGSSHTSSSGSSHGGGGF